MDQQKALSESISNINRTIHQLQKREKNDSTCKMLKIAFCLNKITLHPLILGENTGYF